MDAPALGCKIGRAYQILLRQLAEALKENGLDVSPNEYLILRAVYSSEGLQQSEIAALTGKDKAEVCRCVKGLVNKDYLKVESVSYKCLKVFLTEKSREIEPKIMNVAELRHKALLELTTPDDLKIFTQIIDKIITFK